MLRHLFCPRTPIIEQFTSSLSAIVGTDQLLSYVAAQMSDHSGAAGVFVLLLQPITNRYVGRMTHGGEDRLLAKLSFSPSDRLLEWLATNQNPLDTIRSRDVLDFLTPRERDLLTEARISLVIPASVLGRVVALFLFGPRTKSYSPAEIDILSRLAARSAMAIEFSTLRQFQADRLRKLELADRLSTIGRLASSTAHDVRSPLTLIRSRVQLLGKYIPMEKQELSTGIIEEVDRVNAMLESLLSLSRTGMQRTELDIGGLILSTLSLFDGHIAKQGITLEPNIPDDLRPLVGDPFQLRQALLNILMNSIQAMPDGGKLSITIDSQRPLRLPDRWAGQAGLSGHLNNASTGNSLEILIADTGGGISPENLPKVFDPFFTTREGGTGLGLSISYGIIANHGGDLDIQSSTDPIRHGTQVTILLPGPPFG